MPVDKLVRCEVRLLPEQRHQLHDYVRSLPQHDRRGPAPALPSYLQYPSGAEALILRMLRNRNLNWVGSAKVLFHLVRIGPLAASSVGGIGHGSKVLTPELLAGFATVLTVPADQLAAVVSMELSLDCPTASSTAMDVAELIWDVRRLTADQVEQVCGEAARLNHEER